MKLTIQGRDLPINFTVTNLIKTVATVMPTTSNNANPKEPKKKGRKPYQRDENGIIIRSANKTNPKKNPKAKIQKKNNLSKVFKFLKQ